MKKILFFLLLNSFLFTVSAQEKNKFIPANNPAFEYIGRVQIQNNVAEYNWPGVAVSACFEGKKLGVKIFGGQSNYFNVWVDDQPCWVLHAPADSVYWYPRKLKKGTHCMRVVKRTEADMGMAIFSGVIVKNIVKKTTDEKGQKRRLLVIGNSITCGYGTEGADKNENFKPSTENCEQSYATIVARAFNAEYQLIAHSGLGVIRNYGDSLKVSVYRKAMPKRLEYMFDNDSTLKYKLSDFIPGGIIINLGTNDFSTLPHPDKPAFKKAYYNLLAKLTKNFPRAKIFCLVGPMINEPCHHYVKETVVGFNAENNTNNVVFIGIPNRLLNSGDDLGSNYHPSYKGQLKSAKHIIDVISTVLGWDYCQSEFLSWQNQL